MLLSASDSITALWSRQRALWVIAIVPTIFALLYNAVIASDIYISESRFVVRSQDRATSNPLGAFLGSADIVTAQSDAFTVHDYVLSRDAMLAIQETVDLRSAFGRGDFFSGFPGLSFDHSSENLHRYYQTRVQAHHDVVSSITTLQVRAFTAQEAQAINSQLLKLSEALVNRLNERSRQDMITFAANEVADAEQKAKAAAIAMSSFRNRSGVLDVERQSSVPLQQIAKLQDALIAARSQLAQLQLVASNNPQIPLLRQRVSILESELQREQSLIAGGTDSLASKSVLYQRLALEQKFAESQLASAMSSLEQARSEAIRQHIYLDRIVQPNMPDTAMEPLRIRNTLTVLLIGIVAWAVFVMVRAGIKEHMD